MCVCVSLSVCVCCVYDSQSRRRARPNGRKLVNTLMAHNLHKDHCIWLNYDRIAIDLCIGQTATKLSHWTRITEDLNTERVFCIDGILQEEERFHPYQVRPFIAVT